MIVVVVVVFTLKPNEKGEERLIKQTMQNIHENRYEDDLLMDTDGNLSNLDRTTTDRGRQRQLEGECDKNED